VSGYQEELWRAEHAAQIGVMSEMLLGKLEEKWKLWHMCRLENHVKIIVKETWCEGWAALMLLRTGHSIGNLFNTTINLWALQGVNALATHLEANIVDTVVWDNTSISFWPRVVKNVNHYGTWHEVDTGNNVKYYFFRTISLVQLGVHSCGRKVIPNTETWIGLSEWTR
jgi:hypothetical protein